MPPGWGDNIAANLPGGLAELGDRIDDGMARVEGWLEPAKKKPPKNGGGSGWRAAVDELRADVDELRSGWGGGGWSEPSSGWSSSGEPDDGGFTEVW